MNKSKEQQELDAYLLKASKKLHQSDSRIINSARANRIKADDPAIKAKLSASNQRVLKDPEKVKIRKESARRGGDTKANSEEYQKLMTAVNRKKAENPSFAKNVQTGIKNKWKDPEYLAKQNLAQLKKGTPVIGPDGTEYGTTVIAQDATGIPCRKIRTLAKNNLEGWQYAGPP